MDWATKKLHESSKYMTEQLTFETQQLQTIVSVNIVVHFKESTLQHNSFDSS